MKALLSFSPSEGKTRFPYFIKPPISKSEAFMKIGNLIGPNEDLLL